MKRETFSFTGSQAPRFTGFRTRHRDLRTRQPQPVDQRVRYARNHRIPALSQAVGQQHLRDGEPLPSCSTLARYRPSFRSASEMALRKGSGAAGQSPLNVGRDDMLLRVDGVLRVG